MTMIIIMEKITNIFNIDTNNNSNEHNENNTNDDNNYNTLFHLDTATNRNDNVNEEIYD